jgi:hypothetical protein
VRAPVFSLATSVAVRKARAVKLNTVWQLDPSMDSVLAGHGDGK